MKHCHVGEKYVVTESSGERKYLENSRLYRCVEKLPRSSGAYRHLTKVQNVSWVNYLGWRRYRYVIKGSRVMS